MEKNDRNGLSTQFAELKTLAELAKEEALRSYIACMMRLLNGLSQIEASSFHRYENIILSEPMRVFCIYFIEEVKEALNEMKSALEKEMLIRDIEENICALNDIYEKVINGTANSDKQMFMAMPMNSSTYGISPKLYAVYEELVNRLVRLYDEGKQEEYAFLLDPTLKNVLYAETLFKKREESGKVVIIHMPVRMLEKTNQIPLYLMHEVFHVLTKKERKRKDRAKRLLLVVLMQVRYCLFDGVSFIENKVLDKIWKTELIDGWMEQVFEEYKIINAHEESDRIFYSKNIKKYVIELVNDMLREIEKNLPKAVGEFIYNQYRSYGEDNFNKYDELTKRMIEQLEIVMHNIWKMDYYGLISVWTDELMFLFRESYADMACILTSGYDLNQYKEAFKESVRSRVDDSDLAQDDYYRIRQNLMKTVFSEKREEETSNVAEKNEEVLSDLCKNYVKTSVTDGQKKDSYGIIIKPEVFNEIKGYLNGCRHRLEETMSTKQNEVIEFRNMVNKFRNMDSNLVLDILIGDF